MPKPDFSFDPDAGIKALSYRGNTAVHGKARLEGVAGALFNFYLPSDSALIGWQANQIGVAGGKPISDLITGGYQYDLTGREIQRDPNGTVNRKVTDPHEAMAMVNNSWSNALGREASTGGKIDPSKNLDMGPVSSGMGFGSEHEAVFQWQCAKTWKFYELLWNALDLPKTIAQ